MVGIVPNLHLPGFGLWLIGPQGAAADLEAGVPHGPDLDRHLPPQRLLGAKAAAELLQAPEPGVSSPMGRFEKPPAWLKQREIYGTYPPPNTHTHTHAKTYIYIYIYIHTKTSMHPRLPACLKKLKQIWNPPPTTKSTKQTNTPRLLKKPLIGGLNWNQRPWGCAFFIRTPPLPLNPEGRNKNNEKVHTPLLWVLFLVTTKHVETRFV